MIKTLQKVDTQGSYLNLIKAIYNNPTANIVFNGKKLKVFPLRSETIKGYPLSLLLFSIVLEVLATAIREGKKKRGKQIGKKVKLSLFAHDTTVYTENPKDATIKLLKLIKGLCKVAGYKINIQKCVAFLYTNNTISERGIKEKSPLPLYQIE